MILMANSLPWGWHVVVVCNLEPDSSHLAYGKRPCPRGSVDICSSVLRVTPISKASLARAT
jgi:hypothetical protein